MRLLIYAVKIGLRTVYSGTVITEIALAKICTSGTTTATEATAGCIEPQGCMQEYTLGARDSPTPCFIGPSQTTRTNTT